MDNILKQLEDILEQRKSTDADSSYVASLYEKGTDEILKKIGEESAEVIMATKDDDKDKIIYGFTHWYYYATKTLKWIK